MSTVRTNELELTRVSPSICLEAWIRLTPDEFSFGENLRFRYWHEIAPTCYPRSSFSRVKCEMQWVEHRAREKLRISRKLALDTTPREKLTIILFTIFLPCPDVTLFKATKQILLYCVTLKNIISLNNILLYN